MKLCNELLKEKNLSIPKKLQARSLSSFLNLNFSITDNAQSPLADFSSIPCYKLPSKFERILYLYPKSLNLNSSKFKNLLVRVFLFKGEDWKNDILKCLHKPEYGSIAQELHSHVLYHEKQIEFHEEWKITLPYLVTDDHYLLFYFHNINQQVLDPEFTYSKEDFSEKDAIKHIGFTWLPLLSNTLQSGLFELPVASINSSLASGYSRLFPHLKQDLNWMPKASFIIKTKPVSSIFCTEDPKLDSLLLHTTVKDDQTTASVIHAFHAAEKNQNACFKFFKQVFYCLADITLTDTRNSFSAFATLVSLVAELTNNYKSSVKVDKTDFKALAEDNKPFNYLVNFVEEKFNPVLLKNHENLLEIFSGYWCKMIRNSQSIEINRIALFYFKIFIKTAAITKKFDKTSLENIEVIIASMVKEIIDCQNAHPNQAKKLAFTISYFIDWAMSMFDKQYVFNLITIYYERFTNTAKNILQKGNSASTILQILLYLNRRVFNHSRYTHFIDVKNISDYELINSLTNDNTQLCFTRIVVTNPLKITLDNWKNSTIANAQAYAITTLVQILTVHSGSKNRNVLAKAYVHVLPICIHALTCIRQFSTDSKSKLQSCLIWMIQSLDSQFLETYLLSLDCENYHNFVKIISTIIVDFEPSQKIPEKKRQQNLSILADTILGSGSAASKLRDRRNQSMRRHFSSTETFSRQDLEKKTDGAPALKYFHESVAFSIAYTFLSKFVDFALTIDLSFTASNFEIVTKILETRQSDQIYLYTCEIVQKYARIFDTPTETIAALLKLSVIYDSDQLTSKIANTVFTCLEQGSPKTQMNFLMAINDMIVTENNNFLTFQQSFSLRQLLRSIYELLPHKEKISQLNSKSKSRRSSLFKCVQPNVTQKLEDLTSLVLETDVIILSHISLMQTVDSEMRIALKHQISRSCNNLPAFRIKWLMSCSDDHRNNGRYLEAATCLLHVIGCIYESLGMNCDELLFLAPNILEESLLEDMRFAIEVSRVSMPEIISENAIEHIFDEVNELYISGGHYALAKKLYFYCKNKSINIKYCKIEESHETSAYFRVKFLSSLSSKKSCFDEEVYGKHFIYRMPLHTKLGEVTEKLMTLYPEAKIVQNNISTAENDMILVTFVQTYNDVPLQIIKNSNLTTDTTQNKKFVFSQPFYDNGQKRLDCQMKKKTILTTKSEFPNTTSRIEVVDEYSFFLSPVETAFEDLVHKTHDLENKCEECVRARDSNNFAIKCITKNLNT